MVHTYSGYENAVKTSIEKFVTGRNMEDMILRIEVPMETVTEVTDSGATKEVERKVFPGYVLIKMVMTDDTWHLVRNVRGVTGFVGSANKPIPQTEDEVLSMGMEKHEIVVNYNVGDHVKIVDGPLASFTGVVEEIEPEKNRVSVMVSMFGRETPVELELDQSRSRTDKRPKEPLGAAPPGDTGGKWEGSEPPPPKTAPCRHHIIDLGGATEVAQKITGYVKLQIPAGKATPAPPVGPALGQHGVNIAAFTKEFNERTKNDVGMIIPVVITVYADRSFSFITKTPPRPS